VSAPGPDPFKPVHPRPAPPEVAFEAADPAFAAGSPPDEVLELRLTLDGAPCGARFAFGRQHDLAHTEGDDRFADGAFAIAAVGGHCVRRALGASCDALDRWSQH